MKQILYRDSIYEERLPLPGFKLLVFLMAGLAVLFFGFMVYSLLHPGNTIDGSPGWFWFIMFSLFAFITWLVLNFRELVITMTGAGVEARYGRFKQFQAWNNIAGLKIIQRPGLRYGGWGLRWGWSGGRQYIVYNIWGAPVVELKLKEGKYGKLCFSSRNPQEVASIIQKQTG